jgi:hypothetical protein
MNPKTVLEISVRVPLLVIFTLGVIMILISVDVISLSLNLQWVKIEITNNNQRAIIAFLGVVFLFVPLISFVLRHARERKWELNKRDEYRESLKEDDLTRAKDIQIEMALKKLQSTSVELASVGAHEIAEYGGDAPFRKGFNALATELGRRRNWDLRFAILDALVAVAKPIRAEFER